MDGPKPTPQTSLIRLAKSLAREFSLQSLFKYGYRNKEDVSNLPPETLVIGSQNVLTNAAEIVGIRNGYTLDGAAGNQNNYGIDSSYDFNTRSGFIQNLRKWGSNLEVRYVNPNTKLVSWINILSLLNANKKANFTSFWDQNTELKTFCLFVNGSNSVYEWSGGVASVASVTSGSTGIITALANTPVSGGNEYAIGDILTIIGGMGGTAIVTSVNLAGTITGVVLATAGTGYSNGTANTTTNSVNGSGATVSISSVATGSTITVQGASTLSQIGFYDNAADSTKFNIVINGISYAYVGVSGQTFYGVTPDPTIVTINPGDAVTQVPSSITGANITANGGNMGTTFTFDLIATLANQVWYGDFTNNSVYISKTNNYKDVSFSIPSRLPSEGALITLDAKPVGLSPQSSEMYISAGRDQWWISQTNQQTIDVSGVATPTETLYAVRLKTAFNQGSQEQGLITKYKNSLVYVSNEQIINALGLVKDIYSDPQITNMSDPIKFDVDAYDFTGGASDYDNYYLYFAIPKNGVVRMYNVQKQYWEAPQTLPISRFYHTSTVTGNVLYGHSSLTNESYQLFTGYNDNGNPINSVIAFPYVSSVGGSPFQKKSFNKIYTEGYIASNTNLMLTINYDFGAWGGSYTTIIPGAPSDIIFNKIIDGSLGQNSLGSQPIGTILNLPNLTPIPKFRVINTMPRVDMYEYQIVYSTDDVDFNYSILRMGPAVSSSVNLPANITF